MITKLNKDIRELNGDKVRLEADLKIQQKDLEMTKEAYECTIEKINTDHANDIEKKLSDIQSLNAKMLELSKFEEEKDQILEKLARLETELSAERTQHQQDLEELDRAKIKATEKLKKDMLLKINQTREHVLSLNDQQLHTTTKFTILQNNRLTAELEYQSKQTEKLLNRNTQLEQETVSLKRDIEIHKELESELAKRSHYCQKVIQKLNNKIKDLEHSLAANKRDLKSDRSEQESKGNSRTKDELTRYLENKLEESMNRLARVQLEHNLLQSKLKESTERTSEKQEKYGTVARLLSDYLTQLQTPHNEEVTLNLHRLTTTPIEQLSSSDKGSLVTLLLKHLQPYISPSNLAIPAVTSINIITSPLIQDENAVRKVPMISVGVQTSFALGTFDLPKLEIDAELVKGPVRPWGPKAKLSQSRDSALRKRVNYKK